MDRIDPTDLALLDRFQRDFPLEPRPFARIAVRLGLAEAEVIDRLSRMQAAGRIARVGGTVRPNTAGASTLAALAVPEDRIDEVAAIVGAEAGVNHSYLREADWNLWFVATAPEAAALAAMLTRIEAACPGLGETALYWLHRASGRTLYVLMPESARDLCEYIH